MPDKEDAKFIERVRKAMAEIAAAEKSMPVSAPVTEIIIRVGSSEGVRIASGGRALGCAPPCCCPCPLGGIKITPEDIGEINPEVLENLKGKASEKNHDVEEEIAELKLKDLLDLLG